MKTILIADSGSTKTAWRYIDNNKKIFQFVTEGMHPLFCNSEKAETILRKELIGAIGFPEPIAVEEVYFYGAGCGTESRAAVIRNALQAVFTQSKIEIESDLLGAARGMCGHQSGLVAVLGTGSSSCYYSGQNIAKSRPSLGYILGDEGSGAHIGKLFLRGLLYGETGETLRDQFLEQYKINKEIILNNLYQNEFPNRYLASFSKFVFRNINQEYCYRLVYDSFLAFIDAHISHYDTTNEHLHVTGSVAYFYSKILRSACEKTGIQLQTITENPAAGLSLYHLGEI